MAGKINSWRFGQWLAMGGGCLQEVVAHGGSLLYLECICYRSKLTSS